MDTDDINALQRCEFSFYQQELTEEEFSAFAEKHLPKRKLAGDADLPRLNAIIRQYLRSPFPRKW